MHVLTVDIFRSGEPVSSIDVPDTVRRVIETFNERHRGDELEARLRINSVRRMGIYRGDKLIDTHEHSDTLQMVVDAFNEHHPDCDMVARIIEPWEASEIE